MEGNFKLPVLASVVRLPRAPASTTTRTTALMTLYCRREKLLFVAMNDGFLFFNNKDERL